MNTEPDELPEKEELSFSEALQRLLADEDLPVHLLYRISDLSEGEKVELYERWVVTQDGRREEIARHLADISEDNFTVDFKPFFAYLLADPDPSVRVAALEGLWDATELKLVGPIVAMLESDDNQRVRAAAAAALSHYLLLSAWGELRHVPTELIIEALLAAYHDQSAETPVRRAALESLGSVPSDEVEQLVKNAYESSNSELQLGSLFAMGNSADPRWLPILIDELESPYSEMRVEAARACGSIGHSEAVPGLAELALDDDEEVAATAIEALGLIGGNDAHRALEAMVDDPRFEHLQDIVTLALEDMDWLENELTMLSWREEDEGDDDLIEFDDLDE